MDDSVEVLYSDIVLKFNNFLVEKGGNEIIFNGTQNFIYAFADTFGESNGSRRGKDVINISLGGISKVSDPNQ